MKLKKLNTNVVHLNNKVNMKKALLSPVVSFLLSVPRDSVDIPKITHQFSLDS